MKNILKKIGFYITKGIICFFGAILIGSIIGIGIGFIFAKECTDYEENYLSGCEIAGLSKEACEEKLRQAIEEKCAPGESRSCLKHPKPEINISFSTFSDIISFLYKSNLD